MRSLKSQPFSSLPTSLKLLGFLALTTIGLTTTSAAQSPASTRGPLITTASWQLANHHPILKADLHKFLTEKQQNMINSGFPTYSSLAVAILNPGETSITEEDVLRRAVYQVNCSVTFDTWEERYEVERLTGPVGHLEVKHFSNYSDECLAGIITDPENTAKLASGGLLVASLVVKQTSPEETAKIKAWLVRQQSGLMQGLFSHMLGELALNATAHVIIKVPALTKAGG